MDYENSKGRFESVFSTKVRAGRRRTYFFDVRRTKGDDYYITLTESTRKFNGEGYERHKIFLYKEDFNRFYQSLGEVIEHVKGDLMPDYNYEEFDEKQKQWEERQEFEESTNHTPHSSSASHATVPVDDFDDEVEEQAEEIHQVEDAEDTEPETDQEDPAEDEEIASSDVSLEDEDDMCW